MAHGLDDDNFIIKPEIDDEPIEEEVTEVVIEENIPIEMNMEDVIAGSAGDIGNFMLADMQDDLIIDPQEEVVGDTDILDDAIPVPELCESISHPDILVPFRKLKSPRKKMKLRTSYLDDDFSIDGHIEGLNIDRWDNRRIKPEPEDSQGFWGSGEEQYKSVIFFLAKKFLNYSIIMKYASF